MSKKIPEPPLTYAEFMADWGVDHRNAWRYFGISESASREWATGSRPLPEWAKLLLNLYNDLDPQAFDQAGSYTAGQALKPRRTRRGRPKRQ